MRMRITKIVSPFGGSLKNIIRKIFNKEQEEIIEEEDFWLPGGWTDNRSHWEQYDEMPWNG